MQSRPSNQNLFSVYALVAIPLAALTTFVVGYTASRAHLGQAQEQNIVTEDSNIVIPHAATLWSDFDG